jgi:hypothetical protein
VSLSENFYSFIKLRELKRRTLDKNCSFFSFDFLLALVPGEEKKLEVMAPFWSGLS